MVRLVNRIALVLVIAVPNVQAAPLTLTFSGKVTSVVDATVQGLPPLNFPPIPAGTTFTGSVNYDSDSSATDGRQGYLRYVDLLPSSASLTINGHQFTTAGSKPVSIIVSSQESGFKQCGVAVVSQPLALPPGWSVAIPQNPYLTLQFFDAVPQTRPLTLPSSLADFPTDVMNLVFDFNQSVTVDGETYGGRVYIKGQITSISVMGNPPPPQQVTIDIDPSSGQNKLNLSTKKPKPVEVAVFGAADLDVLTVVSDSVTLGDPVLTGNGGSGQSVAPSDISYEDVNADGALDLLLMFDLLSLQDFGAIDSSTTALQFAALLENGGVVFGSDSIRVLGGKGNGKK